MNSKQIKYKTFSHFQQKYYRKLNQPNSLIEPLNALCGGCTKYFDLGFLQTFKQVINKLSTNKSSPLPLFFPTVDSMQLITKNKVLLRQVFTSFDTRGIGRIDACELYCALITISKGSYEVFLKTVVDVFGFEYPGRILKQEFFFFLDSFFRVIPKIVIIKGYSKPTQPNIRLLYDEIQQFIKTVFADNDELERNQIYEAMLKIPQLNQFMKYLQKKCNNSAEKYRNQTIERVGFEAQIKKCVGDIVGKVVELLKQQNHARILDE